MALAGLTIGPFPGPPSVLSDRPVRKRRPIVPDPPEDPSAQICWGRESDFQVLDPGAAPGLNVEWPEHDECNPNSIFYDADKCEEKEPPCDEYSEDWREYEVVRVTNPDDAEIYVDVERIKKMQFTGPPAKSPDGKDSGEKRKICLVFNHHPNEGSVISSGRRGG